MCTPWTTSKFIRWRVRDWASCFLACRFPLDDHEGGHDNIHISSPQLSIRNMAFCVKDDIIDNNVTGEEEANEKLRRKKRSCRKKERRVRNRRSTVQAINTDDNNNLSVAEISHGISDHQPSSWPDFHEEDYIVFCFGEDGDDFDVVKECKSETSSSECFESTTANRDSTPRPVNRKLNFVEVVETIRKSSSQKRSNGLRHDDICTNREEEIIAAKEEMELRNQMKKQAPTALTGQSDSNCMLIQQQGKEEEGSNLDPQTPSSSGSTRPGRSEEMENGSGSGIVSAESSESNKSNGSTASFTFPALRWELMGSPVQMPKAEDLHVRNGSNTKERVPCARFHYCWRLR